jgi:hypothetical protein
VLPPLIRRRVANDRGCGLAQRKPLTADELLPLTAWIILKGQPAHMCSVLYYVEVFLHLQGLPMAGELAYILTTYAVPLLARTLKSKGAVHAGSRVLSSRVPDPSACTRPRVSLSRSSLGTLALGTPQSRVLNVSLSRSVTWDSFVQNAERKGRDPHQAACEWLSKGAPGVDAVPDAPGSSREGAGALEEEPQPTPSARQDQADDSPPSNDHERAAASSPTAAGSSCGGESDGQSAHPAAPVPSPSPSLPPSRAKVDLADLLTPVGAAAGEGEGKSQAARSPLPITLEPPRRVERSSDCSFARAPHPCCFPILLSPDPSPCRSR